MVAPTQLADDAATRSPTLLQLGGTCCLRQFGRASNSSSVLLQMQVLPLALCAVAAVLTLLPFAAASPTAVASARPTLDGKPWLPWGVYMQGATDADLSRVQGMGFNSVLAYEYGSHDVPSAKSFLDRAQSAKLQVFYALNGFLNVPPYNQPQGTNWTISLVSALKDHPALGAWYICDERPPKYLPILEQRHELVRRLDPNHITYSVLDSGDTIQMYSNISESLGVDPYPFHHDGDNVTKMVPEIQSLITSIKGQTDRSSICVTQIFAWETYGSTNLPTSSYYCMQATQMHHCGSLFAAQLLEVHHTLFGHMFVAHSKCFTD